MGDLIFLGVTVAFFGLAVGLVRVCERIMGPDLTVAAEVEVPERDRSAA